MARVLIKKLNPDVELPVYKTSGASGMDLMAFIEEPIKMAPNSIYLVPTGLSMAFSEDYEVQIRPRSGLAVKNSITVLNTPGTIDSDYRGEIKIILLFSWLFIYQLSQIHPHLLKYLVNYLFLRIPF